MRTTTILCLMFFFANFLSAQISFGTTWETPQKFARIYTDSTEEVFPIFQGPDASVVWESCRNASGDYLKIYADDTYVIYRRDLSFEKGSFERARNTLYPESGGTIKFEVIGLPLYAARITLTDYWNEQDTVFTGDAFLHYSGVNRSLVTAMVTFNPSENLEAEVILEVETVFLQNHNVRWIVNEVRDERTKPQKLRDEENDILVPVKNKESNENYPTIDGKLLVKILGNDYWVTVDLVQN